MNIDPAFIATTLAVVLLPGTGVLYTVTTGIKRGRTAALWASLGCTLGIVPHLLATVLGVAALLHTSAIAFQFVKYTGVAYLLYLAFSTLRDSSAVQQGEQMTQRGRFDIVSKAILINLLNPKLTVFFLAFLPQFIQADGTSQLFQLTVLSLLFMSATLLIFSLYGLLADKFRSVVMDSPSAQKWVKRAAAAAFASMGLKLAFSDR